jgi:hypothetical protein
MIRITNDITGNQDRMKIALARGNTSEGDVLIT